MGMFSVRGGPHEGVTPVEWREVVATAEQAGARRLTHDPDDNVYGFLIDAPTTPHAFAVVREVFRPIYGDNWWAEVSTFPLTVIALGSQRRATARSHSQTVAV